jgi:hypothetical protein
VHRASTCPEVGRDRDRDGHVGVARLRASRVMVTPASGCSRSRSRFGDGASDEPVNSGRGGVRSTATMSSSVTGSAFPARRYTGTPIHRQLSTCSVSATYVSVVEPAATPGVSVYPS